MFRIGSQRTTWVPIEWTGFDEAGNPVQNKIHLQVELVDRDEMVDQVVGEQSGTAETTEFAMRVIRDWKDVADADGEKLPFSEDMLGKLLQHPGVQTAFGQSYLKAWNGVADIRKGNSNASPAAGSKAGRGKATQGR